MNVLDNDGVICGCLEIWRFGWLVECFEKQLKKQLNNTRSGPCMTVLLHQDAGALQKYCTQNKSIFLMVDLLGWNQNHPFDLPNLESKSTQHNFYALGFSQLLSWPLYKRLGTRANFHPPGQFLFGLHFLARNLSLRFQIGQKLMHTFAGGCMLKCRGYMLKKFPSSLSTWCFVAKKLIQETCGVTFLMYFCSPSNFWDPKSQTVLTPKNQGEKPFFSTETGCPDWFWFCHWRCRCRYLGFHHYHLLRLVSCGTWLQWSLKVLWNKVA